MSQPITGVPQSGTVDPQSGTGTDPTGTGAVIPPAADPNATPPAKTYTEAEVEALRARMTAADKNNAAAQAALKKLTDAQLSEQERVAKDLEDTKKVNADLEVKVQKQAVENAFLLDSTYKWKNPASALKLVDLSEVTVEDDGKVKGMKAALDALAKSDPYLLDDASGSTDEDDKGKEKGPSGSTGAPGTTRQHGKGTDATTLANKWPGMRGRVPASG